MTILLAIISVQVAFVIGSIPTAYLFGKARGIDIRNHGSGNVGATNAFRTFGTRAGIFVLLIDIAKGFVVTFFCTRGYAVSVEWLGLGPFPHESASYNLLEIVLAAGVIAGHMWSPFVGWSGGKGVATGVGALIGIDPGIAGIAALAFLVIFVIFRYISLGSLGGALAALAGAIALDRAFPTIMLTTFALVFITIRHRSNIQRIRDGTEPKVRLPWESKTPH